MTDEELAGWARNWHWNDCAQEPVDPSIYSRDQRMLRAFVAALAEEKRKNCKHLNRFGSGYAGSDGTSWTAWTCQSCGTSYDSRATAAVGNHKCDQALTDVPVTSGIRESET